MQNLTGQIGLVVTPSNAFWPRIIVRVGRSPAYHVVVHVGADQCVGAELGGARLRPVSDFPGTIWSRFGYSDRQRSLIAEWARAREGRPYNRAAYVALGVTLLTGVPIPARLERRLFTDARYECAHFAEAALIHAGIRLFDGDRNYADVHPGAYALAWRALDWWPAETSSDGNDDAQSKSRH